MGGVLAWIPAWMEHPRWPTGPSEAQQEWEPPRKIPKGVDLYRRKRLHALGNSVMLAQVWPLFHAIAEIEAAEYLPSTHEDPMLRWSNAAHSSTRCFPAQHESEPSSNSPYAQSR
jgi:hypothetical protein